MAGPRFSGTLVEDDAAPAPAGPRFSGTLVEDDAPASAEGGRAHGALNAFARGVVNGLPIVGPYALAGICLLYTSPSPRDRTRSRMPSSA